MKIDVLFSKDSNIIIPELNGYDIFFSIDVNEFKRSSIEEINVVLNLLCDLKEFDKVWGITYNTDIHKVILQILQSEKQITNIFIGLNNMKIYSDGHIFEEIFAISESYVFPLVVYSTERIKPRLIYNIKNSLECKMKRI